MNVTICDRCGKVMDCDQHIAPPKIALLSRYIESKESYIDIDLCRSCTSSLADWLGNRDVFDAKEVSRGILNKIDEREQREFIEELNRYRNE